MHAKRFVTATDSVRHLAMHCEQGPNTAVASRELHQRYVSLSLTDLNRSGSDSPVSSSLRFVAILLL